MNHSSNRFHVQLIHLIKYTPNTVDRYLMQLIQFIQLRDVVSKR